MNNKRSSAGDHSRAPNVAEIEEKNSSKDAKDKEWTIVVRRPS
jgi:hypothetical protein